MNEQGFIEVSPVIFTLWPAVFMNEKCSIFVVYVFRIRWYMYWVWVRGAPSGVTDRCDRCDRRCPLRPMDFDELVHDSLCKCYHHKYNSSQWSGVSKWFNMSEEAQTNSIGHRFIQWIRTRRLNVKNYHDLFEVRVFMFEDIVRFFDLVYLTPVVYYNISVKNIMSTFVRLKCMMWTHQGWGRIKHQKDWGGGGGGGGGDNSKKNGGVWGGHIKMAWVGGGSMAEYFCRVNGLAQLSSRRYSKKIRRQSRRRTNQVDRSSSIILTLTLTWVSLKSMCFRTATYRSFLSFCVWDGRPRSMPSDPFWQIEWREWNLLFLEGLPCGNRVRPMAT